MSKRTDGDNKENCKKHVCHQLKHVNKLKFDGRMDGQKDSRDVIPVLASL